MKWEIQQCPTECQMALAHVKEAYETKIRSLESEISLVREMLAAQRSMLEDAVESNARLREQSS